MLNIQELAESARLFDNQYCLIRPLSVDGATADVWLALDMRTVSEDVQPEAVPGLSDEEIDRLGLVVAIKIYRPQNALDIEGEQRFRDEYMIVFNCRHTNLIHPTHFSIFEETPYLVLPYCRLGSSEKMIGTKLDKDKVWDFILDVSSGLAYLHALEPPIVHQDIKPANILLDDTHHYAITDFGISSQKGGVHGYYYDEENSGTLAYMAPERFLEGTEPMPQSDIWAFGATLFEILTGKVPFGEEGGRTQMETAAAIPSVPGMPSDIQRLIHDCLSPEPGNRPSAEQIIKAAERRTYPVKSKGLVYGLAAVLAAVLVVCALWFLIPSPAPVTTTVNPAPEALYQTALERMNQDDADSLKAGLGVMDSLSNTNYIPAIYQMAFTYGWYSDSISVKRKQILGIALHDNLIPVSDEYSNKAVALFTRIMELNDSSYADINANSIYRLACYYIMPNHIYKKNYEKGKMFLYRSREWALMAGDKELLRKIEKGLDSFDE